jgi:peroxiredoxin Q/BCP
MLRPGDKAPPFILQDADGNSWNLEDLRGNKVILYFYPADDTRGCTIEACGFRDSLNELDEAGYKVLGVSPQGAESKKAFREKYDINFPLLIDEGASIAKAYDVYEDKGELDGVPILVIRSTFVIDEDGTILNPMYGVDARGHVEKLKSSLQTSA